jgi:hypothetical protein
MSASASSLPAAAASMRASASPLRNSHRLMRFGSNSPRLAVARAHTRAPAVSEAFVRRPRARSDVLRTFAGVRSPRVHARRRARFASSLASALRVPARVLLRTRGHLLASSPQERARRRVRPASSPRIQRAEDALRFPEKRPASSLPNANRAPTRRHARQSLSKLTSL